MAYYPKNRLITGLNANPGEFVTPDGNEYLGEYYKTFDGKTFLGNPEDNSNIQLISIREIETKLTYNNIIKSPKNDLIRTINPNNNIIDLLDPKEYLPIPTEEDYKKGNIIRYFAKQRKTRNFQILEINKPTFLDIQNRKGNYNYYLWDVTSLFWQISGPLNNIYRGDLIIKAGVIDTNKRSINQVKNNFVGLDQYLSNLKQFYKE